MSFNRLLALSALMAIFTFAAVAQNYPVPPDNWPPAGPTGAFQVGYITNAHRWGSALVLSNTGAEGGYDGNNDLFGPPTANRPSGNICANVYVFNACQELISCCTCPTSPNGLYYMNLQQLIGNPAHPPLCPGASGPTEASLNSYVIKVWATLPQTYPTSRYPNIGCNAGRPTGTTTGPFPGGVTDGLGVPGASAMGLKAWRTTYHALAPVTTPDITEVELTASRLVNLERERMVNVCRAYQQNLSGPGICAGCFTGAVAPK